MQGRQSSHEDRPVTITLGALVPPTHVLRRVDRVLDLRFIYEFTRELYCAENGRPSIDPVLFFGMQLIGYLYGIRSERRLCEEIHLNLAYRWFCRLNVDEEVPDHSSLTRIRDRFGLKTYQAIFERMVDGLKGKGLVTGKQVMADATLIEADASINSLQERVESDPQARALKLYERQYHDFKVGAKTRQVSNQTHVSASDPDATLVARPGTYRKLYYKAHTILDAASRVILDCHVTTGARQECTVLPERVAYLLDEGQCAI